MSQDDEAARKARAQKLRGQISKYKKQDDAGEEEKSGSSERSKNESQGGKSPRDFIQDRMRELDENNQ